MKRETTPDSIPLEPFRSYLMVLAQAHLAPELRAKIGASDIVQCTFLKAHRAQAQVRDRMPANLAAWLRQILIRVMQDAVRDLRRDKRDIRCERSLATAVNQTARRLEDLIPADQITPSKAVARADLLVEVSRVLEALPELQREAILMKHCQGYTVDEVAQRLDRSPAAVASLLRRGLKQVRGQLSPNGRRHTSIPAR